MSTYWRKPDTTLKARETKKAMRPCLKCDTPFMTTIRFRVCETCKHTNIVMNYGGMLEADQWHSDAFKAAGKGSV